MEDMQEYVPRKMLSFGQKAVGMNLKGSAENSVEVCNQGFADRIDQMNDLRIYSDSPEVKRLASLAITQAQIAQICSLKALTWKD